ncbi:hypothetical protein VTN96DRAFT_6305 [Rasamsonia emersonii]
MGGVPYSTPSYYYVGLSLPSHIISRRSTWRHHTDMVGEGGCEAIHPYPNCINKNLPIARTRSLPSTVAILSSSA